MQCVSYRKINMNFQRIRLFNLNRQLMLRQLTTSFGGTFKFFTVLYIFILLLILQNHFFKINSVFISFFKDFFSFLWQKSLLKKVQWNRNQFGWNGDIELFVHSENVEDAEPHNTQHKINAALWKCLTLFHKL